jgi:hypothetical protein
MKTHFNPWPFGIIAVFVLLFIGITAVIIIAFTHRETLVSENYYEQEITYQSQIDDTARAQKSGAAISSNATGGKLVISLPVAQLAQKLSGTIELYRPSDPTLDQTIRLAPRADGTQSLDSAKLAAGLWRVRVKWNAGGQNYFLEQKFNVARI